MTDMTESKVGTIVNDFAFSVATANGSGSQTSNNVLVRTLFDMGIPVNGKNLFPSNIKGLPTWYIIRASKDGYTARRDTTEIVIAYNQATAVKDLQDLPAGGVLIIDSGIRGVNLDRDDISIYEVPVKKIMKTFDLKGDLKNRVANMTYVGVVAQLFDLPLDNIYEALVFNFGGRKKLADINMPVIQAAYEYAAENFTKTDSYRFEEMDGTKGKMLITGNDAGALGAIFGGVQLISWYPITPSTSLVDAAIKYKKLRTDEDGKSTVAIVQAEDELAAAGMIIGGGFGGVRSMTATSGPGISLMAEFTGLAYFAEIPAVFWNITRMGPSTGMPTRTSQGDILFTHLLGHGDSRQLCLLPGSPEEAFEDGWRSFDIAEQMQMPVFVISDLDLGMNNWMSDPFEYPEEDMMRGKVLNADQLATHIEEHGSWGRYKDVDGDGIGYRTLPGTDHPMGAYFARGTGHDEYAVYSEDSQVWLDNMARLRRKMRTALDYLPAPIVETGENAEVAIISHGTNHPAIMEARDRLSEQGIETDYMRVRSLPLHDEVKDFTFNYKRVYVIENNYDGQLLQIMRMDYPEDTTHVTALTLADGLPMTARWIVDNVTEHEGNS
ncbi:MAG: 2-oxoacid:acceptor oxidoreductase subunit alpha [Aggregatilineales bacterium]